MWPLAGFALGTIVGAVGVALRGTEMAKMARPSAKAVLKTAIVAFHEARVRQAEMIESAEDLYAEATSEVAAEKRTSAKAAVDAGAQKAADALREEQIRRSEIVKAVSELYAKAGSEPTSEELAGAIAAAEARAEEIVAAIRTANSSAAPIDLFSVERRHTSASSHG